MTWIHRQVLKRAMDNCGTLDYLDILDFLDILDKLEKSTVL